MKKETEEIVLTHLEYIKKRVDDNYNHLQKLNGRVRNNEISISWIKGIGASVTFIISAIISFLIKE